jgi:hypothetical protein
VVNPEITHFRVDTLTKDLPESLHLMSRYETHINRQLEQALDKLRELEAESLNAGAVDSNGNTWLKVV